MKFHRTQSLILWGAMLAFLAGCGVGKVTNQEGKLKAIEVAPGEVTVYNSGFWSDFVRCSPECVYNHQFWIDLNVKTNQNVVKVGIQYSTDEWETFDTSYARYVERTSQDREKWNVNVSLGVAPFHPPEVQYRAFVETADGLKFEPRVRYIYLPVSENLPVRLLWSTVDYEPESGVVFTGRVRVFDFDPEMEKRVAVRYTTDGWATSKEVSAEVVSSSDWGFRVENLGKDILPEYLDFAVNYSVPGELFWDNNSNNNYYHQIAPAFSTNFLVPHDQLVKGEYSGIINVQGKFSSDLPVERIDYQLNEQSWQEGQSLVFSTMQLTNGEHILKFRATLVGGYESTTEVRFNVNNQVLPVEEWDLPYLIDTNEAPLDMAVDTRGRFYVLYPDGLLARFGSFAQSEGPDLFYVSGAAEKLVLDEANQIYILEDGGDRLWRFLNNGQVDPTFGNLGVIDLDDPANGGNSCSVTDLVAGGGYLFLVDSCFPRVVRFDQQGRYAGVLPLDGETRYIPHALAYANSSDSVWVMSRDLLGEIQNSDGALMSLERKIALNDAMELNPQTMSISEEGVIWSVDGRSRLVGLNKNGELIASWSGPAYPWETDYMGVLRTPFRVQALGSYQISIMSAQSGQVVNFSYE